MKNSGSNKVLIYTRYLTNDFAGDTYANKFRMRKRPCGDLLRRLELPLGLSG